MTKLEELKSQKLALIQDISIALSFKDHTCVPAKRAELAEIKTAIEKLKR